jgi:Domain of unknown function (DUF4338)
MDLEWTIRRRRIGQQDLLLIRELIRAEGRRGRSYISNRLCEIWDWRQDNGRFRQIACRHLLRQLEGKGLVKLPPMLKPARRAGYVNRVPAPFLLDQSRLAGPLPLMREELRIDLAEGAEAARLFKGLIGTYHYLGYQQAKGAQVKYLVRYRERPVACLSFGPAALKVAARDQFIGWSVPHRQARLPWVVNNERFLLLPWVEVPNLASWVLSRCVRRLRSDWQRIYQQDLVLVETFIEKDRFRGSCYAAANWTCIGESCGRGRNDRLHQESVPIKTHWLYALRADYRQVLCRPLC